MANWSFDGSGLSLRGDTDIIAVPLPLLVDVSHEDAGPALNVGLDDTSMGSLIALVLDRFTTCRSVELELEVGLQFKTAGSFVVDYDTADTHHSLVNCRVVVKEGLGRVEVSDTLVDVEFVEESFKRGESMFPDPFPLDFHGEPVFSFIVLVEVESYQLGVTFAEG